LGTQEERDLPPFLLLVQYLLGVEIYGALYEVETAYEGVIQDINAHLQEMSESKGDLKW